MIYCEAKSNVLLKTTLHLVSVSLFSIGMKCSALPLSHLSQHSSLITSRSLFFYMVLAFKLCPSLMSQFWSNSTGVITNVLTTCVFIASMLEVYFKTRGWTDHVELPGCSEMVPRCCSELCKFMILRSLLGGLLSPINDVKRNLSMLAQTSMQLQSIMISYQKLTGFLTWHVGRHFGRIATLEGYINVFLSI